MHSCFLNTTEAKHKSVLVTQLTLFWDLKLLIIPHYLFFKNGQVKYYVHGDESVKTKTTVELCCYGYLHIYTKLILSYLMAHVWLPTLLYINFWRMHVTQKLHNKDKIFTICWHPIPLRTWRTNQICGNLDGAMYQCHQPQLIYWVASESY